MNKKKVLNYLGIFLFLILVGYAINTVVSGFKVNDSANTQIDAHGTCQKVTNNNCAGSGIFVPTKTTTEWSNFRSNKPTCAALSSCFTYSWKTSSYGACSVTPCNQQGTRTRSVWCERSDVTTVSDSFCSGGKPGTSTSCWGYYCSGIQECGFCEPHQCWDLNNECY